MYKIEQELFELQPPASFHLEVASQEPADAALSFKWDHHKFMADKTTLNRVVRDIVQSAQVIDTDFRKLSREYHNVLSQIQGIERQRDGSLASRALDDLITEDSAFWFSTDSICTVVVVVPRAARDEFLASYHELAEFVVPRSHAIVQEDDTNTLLTVLVLRRCADEFKLECRKRHFAIREFTPRAVGGRSSKIEEKLQRKREDLYRRLLDLSQASYGPVFECWLHTQAVLCHVEGVLRFGLPAVESEASTFAVKVCRARPGSEKLLNATLQNDVFADLYKESATKVAGREVALFDSLSDADAFLPFIFFPLALTSLSSFQWKAVLAARKKGAK
eukprot:gnl/Chilomastix_cuspidata/1974.p2 GENE.gnl/Chilomastix_cuspidata/1974~~gnl/Chilomastix_cuspidata/1974.p2  ORF type:complete len:334 (+),score=190.47 gnl/Chilomastix_cuspidata/1974:219-1220(+)